MDSQTLRRSIPGESQDQLSAPILAHRILGNRDRRLPCRFSVTNRDFEPAKLQRNQASRHFYRSSLRFPGLRSSCPDSNKPFQKRTVLRATRAQRDRLSTLFVRFIRRARMVSGLHPKRDERRRSRPNLRFDRGMTYGDSDAHCG